MDRRIVATLMFGWLAVSVSAARAVVIAEESFDYKPNTAMAGLNGGKGWDGPWFASPLNQRDNLVAEPGLSLGKLAVSGNKMRQVGNDIRSYRKIDMSRKEMVPFVTEGKYGKTLGKEG